MPKRTQTEAVNKSPKQASGLQQLPIRRTDGERRQRQADAVARKLFLLRLLMGRGRWTPSSLARELEQRFGTSSEQTVYRDLRVLRLAGVPIDEWDPRRGHYTLRRDFQLPVLNLTQDELLDQVTASAITAFSGLGIGDGARAATDKMAAASTDETQQFMAEVATTTNVLSLNIADHSECRRAIRTIQRALVQGKQLCGQYASPYLPGPVSLTLNPLQLCLIREAWYLVANPDDAEPRTYRVQRFRDLKSSDRCATIAADFDLAQYFGKAWGVYRSDTAYHVSIEFAAEVAPVVLETKWHATQKAKRRRDGRVVLDFKVDGLPEVLSWVLSWSGKAKVLKPTELRLMVVEQLHRGLRLNASMT